MSHVHVKVTLKVSATADVDSPPAKPVSHLHCINRMAVCCLHLNYLLHFKLLKLLVDDITIISFEYH